MTYSSLSDLTPLAAKTRWGNVDDDALFMDENCSQKIHDWLFDSNSLTAKLEALTPDFYVEVQQQVMIAPSPLLSGYFNNEKQIYLREVLLYSKGVPVIFAQTDIPYSTLTQDEALLAHVGDHSLGKILFNNASMRRGRIEATCFEPQSKIHQYCEQLNQPIDKPIWARRSLFYLNNKPLLVTELFLPALGIY